MDAPFTYGRIAERPDFVDREAERAKLVENFGAAVNTTIVSPRRWGKSSLVTAAAADARKADKRLRVCLIDVFGARNEAEFYAQLTTGVLAASASKWQEWTDLLREFLGALRPKVSVQPDPLTQFSVELDWEEARRSPADILDLAEKIAVARKLRLVVCIDEFQSISDYSDPLGFQRLLRSHWQRHQHVSYCLYGSKRHMLTDIFTNPSMPFYRFGDLMVLEKIPGDVWAGFVVQRFADTGKTITPDDAAYLASLVENHSYYVQQLAQQTWFRATPDASRATVDSALAALLDQLSLQFVYLTESLTTRQLRLLRAVAAGETGLSSQATLKRYDLGTSANVTRMKETLTNREIIDVTGGRLEILDPLFALWLRRG